MKRRDFILALGGTALFSNAARGQETLPVVGVLAEGPERTARAGFGQVKDRLTELGYVEGRNIFIEYRGADYQPDRLTASANELVQRRVAAIVTLGGPPTVAAKAATASIPIIFYTGYDPVISGYIDSLNRPGHNLTGVYILNPQAIFKRLEALHELVPTAKTIAFFDTWTGDATETFYAEAFRIPLETLGVNIVPLSASHVDDLQKIFAEAEARGAGAIIVNAHAVFWNNIKLVTDLAAGHMIPTMYPGRGFVSAGGLISYGTDNREAFRQMGDMVGRVLQGEIPQNLPVQQVTKLELVINARTAKSLGLEIPLHLLGLAEVIE